jgi:TonB family protein
MEQFFLYIVRVSIYLAVFALAYKMLLSRKINPEFNRYYLLFSGIGAALLGFFTGFTFTFSGNTVPNPVVDLPEIVVYANSGYIETTSFLANGLREIEIIQVLILLSGLVVLTIVFVQLIKIMLLINQNPGSRFMGLTLVEIDNNTPPFSFFHWLFAAKELTHQQDFAKILAHEHAHYKRLHSIDVLVFELLHVLFWFHPAYYYLRNELKTMHEFEADAMALKIFDKKDYQQTLLSLSFSGGMIPISNPFNVSLIKKRMLMMNQNKRHKPAQNWLKLLIILPFMTAAILIQSCSFDKKEVQTEPRPEDIMSVKVDSAGSVTASMVNPKEAFADAEPIEGDIFTVVEEMPVFPGGPEAMMKFISNNIQYPEKARKEGIQGRVYVNFIIEKDGSVSSAKVLRGIGGGCDEEALRVVEMMPDWTPGKQRGQAVRVSFNLPVKFLLD